MSMVATPSAWLCRKLRRVDDGEYGPGSRYLARGGLTALDTELEQLAVNPRGAPRAGWQGTSGGSIPVFPCSRVVAQRPTATASRAESLGRCHWTTVAGFTSTMVRRQRGHPGRGDRHHPIDGVQARTAA